MVDESVAVRLARIEEGLVHIHGKMDTNHADLKAALGPLTTKMHSHHMDIAILKRDRWWLFTLVAGVVTLAEYTLHTFK